MPRTVCPRPRTSCHDSAWATVFFMCMVSAEAYPQKLRSWMGPSQFGSGPQSRPSARVRQGLAFAKGNIFVFGGSTDLDTPGAQPRCSLRAFFVIFLGITKRCNRWQRCWATFIGTIPSGVNGLICRAFQKIAPLPEWTWASRPMATPSISLAATALKVRGLRHRGMVWCAWPPYADHAPNRLPR